VFERCWTANDNLPLVHKRTLRAYTSRVPRRVLRSPCLALLCVLPSVLTICHAKDPDGTVHTLSKAEVEAGLKGWKKQDLENVITEAAQAEVCERFQRQVKAKQTRRHTEKEDRKQSKAAECKIPAHSPVDLPSAPPSKRQRITRSVTPALAPTTSAAAASSSAAAAAASSSSAASHPAFNLLPFAVSAIPVDGAHFRLSAVPNSWRPDRLPDGFDALSPFMGFGYRYLRTIPFAPINYKLALISPEQQDQQYNRDWITWTQQQTKAPPGLTQQTEQEFWQLAGDGNTTRMHFKDMEQWYHAQRGASNEAIKLKPSKNKDTHIQRVHNPWRFAQIETKAENTVRGLEAVEAQFHALKVPISANPQQQPQQASLLTPDVTDQLHRAWRHRHCDRNSQVCVADQPAPEEHQHWIPDCTVFHPVNFNYLSSHPKNLLSILPHYCRFTWIRVRDGKTYTSTIEHTMYEFSGMTSGSWYVKCGDDFFYLHIEQLSTWFANFCHEGAMRWYFIAWTEIDGIVRTMLKALARQTHNTNNQAMMDSISALAANPAAEPQLRNLIRMLILGKRCLPSIDALRAEGVQVDIVDQYAGQMVMGDGVVFHQGRSLTPSNVHEAINFIPITWLLTGLPELLATLKDFEQFPAAYEAIKQSKWSWITDQLKQESFLFAHVLVPMEWSFCFLSLLQEDLEKYIKQRADAASPASRFDYSSLSEPQCKLALKQIEQCIDKLCNSDSLYKFYKLCFKSDATLQQGNKLQQGSVSPLSALTL